MEMRVRNDAMNVHEQPGKAFREVTQETFGHRSQGAFHVVREVLIVMFLRCT